MIPLTSLIFQKQLCSNEFEKTGLKLLRVVYSKMNLKKILFFNIINKNILGGYYDVQKNIYNDAFKCFIGFIYNNQYQSK